MKPLYKTLISLAVVSAMTGCASTKKVEDTSPQHPTVVLKAKYHLNGLYLPELNGQQVVYTSATQRRLDHDNKFRNLLMRWANSNSGAIANIDDKVSYMLDHDKKQYRECPLAGCSTFSFNFGGTDSDDEAYESYESIGCEVSIVSNDLSVVKTGQKRVISNMPAEEYKVQWQLVLQDPAAKKDTNLVQMSFWTTTPDAQMQQAWQVHRQFQTAYAEHAEDNILIQLLGKEAYMGLAAITGDIEKTGNEQYNDFLQALTIIEGYPLSIKAEWYRDTQSCQEKRRSKKQNSGVDLTAGLGTAARSLLSGVVDQQKERILDEWRKKPLFHYLYDVTEVKEQMIHDSLFMPPVNYMLTDRQ